MIGKTHLRKHTEKETDRNRRRKRQGERETDRQTHKGKEGKDREKRETGRQRDTEGEEGAGKEWIHLRMNQQASWKGSLSDLNIYYYKNLRNRIVHVVSEEKKKNLMSIRRRESKSRVFITRYKSVSEVSAWPVVPLTVRHCVIPGSINMITTWWTSQRGWAEQ